MRALVLVFVASLALAVPAAAQVRLEFNGGRVNLTAQNVPLRTILAEWARLGGTQIVNADRVTGAPMTLELTGVNEQQAIEILLRSVSGYLLGARAPGSAGGTAGASAFDRILILPTSTVSASPVTTPAPVVRAQVPPLVFDQTDPNANAGLTGDDDEPGGRGRPPNVTPRVVGGPNGVPLTPPPPPPLTMPSPAQPQPTEPRASSPAPGNPFNVMPGSSRPGVITPVPQPQNRDSDQP